MFQLIQQYQQLVLADKLEKNIQSLRSENSFTVVTGHQICSAGGPLYLIYKLFTAIRITQDLNASQTEFNFVPVYWMATEDHDFDEINFFNFKNPS